MIAVRVAKIVLVAALALHASLVAFGNITDYGTNFSFVQHVLSMDTIFSIPGSATARSPIRPCTISPMLSSSPPKRSPPCCAGSAPGGCSRSFAPGLPHSTGRKRLRLRVC